MKNMLAFSRRLGSDYILYCRGGDSEVKAQRRKRGGLVGRQTWNSDLEAPPESGRFYAFMLHYVAPTFFFATCHSQIAGEIRDPINLEDEPEVWKVPSAALPFVALFIDSLSHCSPFHGVDDGLPITLLSLSWL